MQSLSGLRISHLAHYGCVGLYFGTLHPESWPIVSVLFGVGLLVESLPRLFKRRLIPTLLILAVGSWYWRYPPDSADAIHGGVGMGLAYWLLIPSRLGRLKWLLALVGLELVWVARLPYGGLAYLSSIPIGLSALATDRWLLDCVPARSHDRSKLQMAGAFFHWALAPALFLSAIALATGPRIVKETIAYYVLNPRAFENRFVARANSLQESLSIGDHLSVGQESRIAARLTVESGTPAVGMVYLRAVALSKFTISGTTIHWGATNPHPMQAAPAAVHRPTRWAQIQRQPSRTDVVLHPDGGDITDLNNLVIDEEGNLYRPKSSEAAMTYRAEFDDRPLRADPALWDRCLSMDPRLSELPWKQIEDPRWRNATPEHAATLICERLQERCQYALENLPAPEPSPAGVLRKFLFSSSAAERRGHCQYFSTAAVLLLRRAGHPARCVAGFASDELDQQSIIFRFLHAHAWIEVVNSQGCWQRFDPTPSAHNRPPLDSSNSASIQPSENSALDSAQSANPQQNTQAFFEQCAEVWWTIPLCALLWFGLRPGLTAFFSRKRRDPRLSELERRHEGLIDLAKAIGIPVKPSTSLSNLVTALETRTGMILAHFLDSHLAARFGHGPLPAPWPIAALTSAAKKAPPFQST